VGSRKPVAWHCQFLVNKTSHFSINRSCLQRSVTHGMAVALLHAKQSSLLEVKVMKRAIRFTFVLLILSATLAWSNLPQVMIVQGANGPESEPLIRATTNLVTIYASVSDINGRFIAGLKPDNFEIYDNGTRQDIEYFSQEERPLSIGIVFDTSASMKDRIGRATEALNHFLQLQHNDDEYFLLTFNTTVHMAHNYTASKANIINSLNDVCPSGLTALNDAIYAGIEKLKQGRYSKRALLVISDGQDNSSWYNSKDLSNILREADVQIFTVGITDEGKTVDTNILEREGRALLRQFSEQSGGRAFFPTNMEQFDKTLAQVSSELRNQYSLGFSPSSGLDGRWHKLQVKVKNDTRARLAVRSRTGYKALNK
jgi:Ca-activated chloride channel homolog